jgi:hypothetical protein
MRVLAHVATSALVITVIGAAALHCDNGAVGVEACRQIEDRRCELVVGCPNVSIETEADVIACKSFYRDQCMFGIADAEQDPDDVAIEACLAALSKADACKAAETIAACADPPALAAGVATSTTGCDLIQFPERLADCGFLAGETTTTSGGMGGTPVVGGMGGTGGTPVVGGMGGTPVVGGMGGTPVVGGMGGTPSAGGAGGAGGN